MSYEPRTYRGYTKSDDLVSFRVTVLETDLFISADKDLSKEAVDCVRMLRGDLETYIARHPEFKISLRPLPVDIIAPLIVRDMADAAEKACVGPMAAVAGAIAQGIGEELLKFSTQVIVENGGDIFISSKKPRIIGIYAGESKFSEKINLEIAAQDTPCGVCTSSGTVGHSLSFGSADAAVIMSESASLADAAATAICNRVHCKDDIDSAISYGRAIKGINGILIIAGDVFGAWGKIKLVDRV